MKRCHRKSPELGETVEPFLEATCSGAFPVSLSGEQMINNVNISARPGALRSSRKNLPVERG
jgi:hypothetical protein